MNSGGGGTVGSAGGKVAKRHRCKATYVILNLFQDLHSSRFTLHSSPKKRAAFTLSEVLITLGIIGVVAALTLPSVIQNQQERATVAKVKKAYSILSQAFTMAIAENGPVNYWCNEEDLFASCSYKIFNKVKPYLKTINEGKHYGTQYGVAYKYSNRFNDVVIHLSANGPNLTLSDGISVIIEAAAGEQDKSRWCLANTNSVSGSYVEGSGYRQTGYCAFVYVDINSAAGPNVYDKDLFRFKLFRNGVAPGGLPVDKIWTETFENQCLGKNYYQGGFCSGWVVINGNMDYLHCDDLSWDGKKTCK